MLINLLLSLTLSFASMNQPTTNKELRNVAVMIVNTEMNSGGTGSVLKSNKSGSTILTNSHVCEVAKDGGFIIHGRLRTKVIAYKQYDKHDLCLIKVNRDLGINLKLAKTRPEMADVSVVSGFPRLMPNTITKGHFSDLLVISVMVGEEPCSDEEYLTNMLCALIGIKPIVKSFKSQHTSNLIQPGNSGSAVFNEKGEVAGVVFAGMDELGFAFIVPYDFVVDFIQTQNSYQWQFPTISLDNSISASSNGRKQIRAVCTLINLDFCKNASFDMLYRN